MTKVKSKKKKWVKVGWMPQSTFSDMPRNLDTRWHFFLEKKRGGRKNWLPIHWPPRKVRVTIEEI
jgi:hypothetical protein